MTTTVQETPLATDYPENWTVSLSYAYDLSRYSEDELENLLDLLSSRDAEQEGDDPDKLFYMGINGAEDEVWFIVLQSMATQRQAVEVAVMRSYELLKPERIAIKGLSQCVMSIYEITEQILKNAGAKTVTPDELDELTFEDIEVYITTDVPEIDVTVQAREILNQIAIR